jgi:histidine ammonia-lyase
LCTDTIPVACRPDSSGQPLPVTPVMAHVPPAEPDWVTIGVGHLTIADVVAVAQRRAAVALHPGVLPQLLAARAVVERAATGSEAIYGLTTGLGAAVDTRLAADAIAGFQNRAVVARAVGVGERLSVEETRAALVSRLAGMAQGASGISPAVAQTVLAMLNRGVHPRPRRTGSLGEADLSPLAQMFLPLTGHGDAEFDGETLPGRAAMERAGIPLPSLGAKDGIALINANAFTVGLAALSLDATRRAADALMLSAALALEAFRANLSPIDPRLVALRPAPGQADASRRLGALLAGSDLFEPGAARRVQDPLSFRAIAPVHGAAAEACQAARAAVEIELNGAGDSPAVLVDGAVIRSTVNFDTTALALAFEGLGLALSHMAAIAAFRIAKLMSPAFADLPRFLTRHGGTHAGFATAQKTAAALEAEIRHLAHPLGPMTMAVADGVEDYAPMTPRIVDKTTSIAARLMRLAAIELTVAAQAVDLRHGIRLGSGTARAHAFVRARVAPLDEDRPMGEEFERLAQAIAAGELEAALPQEAAA